MRRATENLTLEIGQGEQLVKIEGGELRNYLLALDDLEQIALKVERRLRDGRVVEILANTALKIDKKDDFAEKANLEEVFEQLKNAGVPPELHFDEGHSAWRVIFHDSTNAERAIDLELAAQPEFKKLRSLAKQVSKYNTPPYMVIKGDRRDKQGNWRDLLNYLKTEGKREITVQRYKGLGEMNAEQLAETTMNPEKRTLLRVRLEDLVESDAIFTTLMGEDVESRRKFIEDNALEVKNLDV